jgi:HK97 family phage portal protein
MGRMSIFNLFKKRKQYPVPFSQIVQGQIISPSDNKQAYLTDGYLSNDIIYSIISLISDKIRLPEWAQYEIVDENKFKEYKAEFHKKEVNAKKLYELKSQALKKIKGDAKINELLNWPNEYETFNDFVASGAINKLITGDRYVYAEILKAGANGGKPQALHNLPSHLMSIEATRTFPQAPLAYNIFTQEDKFTREEVLHEKYFNPEWSTNGAQLYGLSPLKAAVKRYTRNNEAMTAASVAFKNQGVKGFISPDISPQDVDMGNIAIMGEQAAKVKKLLTSAEYSGADSYGKMVATAYRMNWTDIGLSPVDMQIIESEKWDAIMLCNIYGVPPELLGLTQKTYNNVKEAEKALTTRCAFPLLTTFRDAFNHKLNTDWGFKGKNIYIDYDFSIFTELNDNMGEKVDWVNKLWMLSPNEQLNILGLPKNDNPLFDEPWIDGTKQPMSEVQANEIDKMIGDE